MMAMLVWACLASAATDCRLLPIAAGIATDDQCTAFKPLLVAGFFTLNPNLKLRPGTDGFCVTNPEWWLHRFQA